MRLRSSLGEDEPFPVEFFFRSGDAFMPFERYALELCRGSVLDLGAGVGPHALALQDRGFDVLAVETCRDLVAIQKERGVRRSVCADFRYWSRGGFDTVLMLMNGLGPLGTLDGLSRYLQRAPQFLAPGGQLLVDSAEALPEPGAVSLTWPPAGGYPGQAWIEISYGEAVGRPFRELYLDLATLRRAAAVAGWRLEIPFEGEQGSYVARLTRP